MRIEQLEEILAGWQESLCLEIELAGLIAKNSTAHKWKATYRSIVLRELVMWRFTDLMAQVAYLLRREHILGARVLIRSGIETLGILVYLNQITEAVLNGEMQFFDFAEKTSHLMLGSRNKSTGRQSINIVSVLEKCDKQYPGILETYSGLSESAHPNFEGVCMGYSHPDETNYKTVFRNRWVEQFGTSQLPLIEIFLRTMETEYNERWPRLFDELEEWLTRNDARLQSESGRI